MRVVICTLADYASIAEGDKLNIMGIFDTIFAKDFPTRHPSMFLVLRILQEYEDSETTRSLRIKLEGPDGAELVKIEGEIKVGTLEPGHIGVANNLIQLGGVEFKHSGVYTFRVFIDDEQVADTPLRLRRR